MKLELIFNRAPLALAPALPFSLPASLFRQCSFIPPREETSIIFAWKLFINLPVKHSIEPFTSHYRTLLGTYWQLSKYLHRALKHLVPSELKKLLCQAENYQTPFPIPSPLLDKGKLPSSIPLSAWIILLSYWARSSNKGNSGVLGEKEQHFQDHVQNTPRRF